MNTSILRQASTTASLRVPSAAPMPPLLQIAAVGCLFAAVVATAIFSLSNTRDSAAHQWTSTIVQATGNGASSVLTETASPTFDASSRATNAPLWASEIMDSHESIQSLAALGKTSHAKEQPVQNSALTSPPGLALLD